MTTKSGKKKNKRILNYKTIKVPMSKVLKHEEFILLKIEERVRLINRYAMIGNEFLKLYLIDKFNNKEELPKVTKDLMLGIFRCIGNSKSKKPIKNNKDDDLRLFYNSYFNKIYSEKLDYSNLSYSLPLLAEQIVTCLETNIKTHFLHYLNRFVNVKFIKKENLSKEELKSLRSEIRAVKNDIINKEIKSSNEKYHSFVLKTVKKLFSFDVKKSILYDLEANPQRYIFASFYLNRKIEKLGFKPYQVIPQRTNLVPRNIILDTAGMIQTIHDTNIKIFDYVYSEMLSNIKEYQYYTWKTIFDFNSSIFKQKNHSFHYQIQTDGISVSLLFINKKFACKKKYDKLPEEVLIPDPIKLEELSEKDCKRYSKKTLIGIDPGKRDLVTMTDGTKFYSYSARRRKEESYARRSEEILKLEKEKNNIIEIETELSKNSFRTYNLKKNKEYILNRLKYDEKLIDFYSRPVFRKLRFRRFSRTKKSEDKMLSEIERKFGPPRKLLLGLGNWSNKSLHSALKNNAPSLTRGIHRLLSRKFNVVEVDEFKTSKTYILKNRVFDLEKHTIEGKKIHTLLTPQRKPFAIMNRDRNASKNIQFILKSWIEKGERPLPFRRTSA